MNVLQIHILEVGQRLIGDIGAVVAQVLLDDAPEVGYLFFLHLGCGDAKRLEALGLALDKQQDKFFGAWLEAIGSDWDTPAGRDIIWRSRSSKTSDLLVKILLNKKTKDEEKPRYIRALDFQSGPEKDAALIKLIGAGS